MDNNDRILANSNADLKLLIDSSAFLTLRDIAKATSVHPLNLLASYPNVDYFFSEAVVNELMTGKEGITQDTLNMMALRLEDESHYFNDEEAKDNRFLYNSTDGTIKVVKLNNISHVDSGQILLCQNHHGLVLLTNDHKMFKSGAPLLDNHLMDVLNLLELMVETPEEKYRIQWVAMKKWYDENYGFKRPENVPHISDKLPRERPAHLKEIPRPEPRFKKN